MGYIVFIIFVRLWYWAKLFSTGLSPILPLSSETSWQILRKWSDCSSESIDPKSWRNTNPRFSHSQPGIQRWNANLIPDLIPTDPCPKTAKYFPFNCIDPSLKLFKTWILPNVDRLNGSLKSLIRSGRRRSLWLSRPQSCYCSCRLRAWLRQVCVVHHHFYATLKWSPENDIT